MQIQILNISSVTKRNRWDNCSNSQIYAKNYRPKLLEKVCLQCKYLSNAYINQITKIAVKIAIIPSILMVPPGYIVLTFAVKKNALYLFF